jgi:methylated-DNA-[protein]-cysteine S-methyltransferase
VSGGREGALLHGFHDASIERRPGVGGPADYPRVVAVRCVRYEAPGWGVGELWLDGDTPVWHEHPRPNGHAPEGSHALADRFLAYFAGEPVSFDDVEVELDDETDFGRALAGALRGIPRGEVVTYGELAALAGRPGAARAAGTFCARNRLAILIPCHRVVGADGLGSYGSLGLEYKRRLLALEGARL